MNRRLQRPWLGRSKPLALLFAVAITAFVPAGCGRRGPPQGTVHGRIVFNEKPVGAGFVIFENLAQGWTRSDGLTAAGTYRLVEVPVGQYVVRIVPPNPDVVDDYGVRAADKPPPIPDPKNIPQRFREGNTTPLRAAVGKGPNRHDFDLSE